MCPSSGTDACAGTGAAGTYGTKLGCGVGAGCTGAGFSNNSLLGSTIRNDAMAELYSQLKILNERGTQDASGK